MRKLSLIFSIMGLFFLTNAPIYAFAQEIVVIVNSANTKEILSKAELREIFMGKTAFWDASLKITPINQTEEKIVSKYINTIVGLPPEVYKNYWVKKLFQEGVMPPTQKTTGSEVINSVSGNTGAIGYLLKSDFKEKSGVKIVFTIE